MKVVIYDSAFHRIINTDPRVSELCRLRAEEIIEAAKGVFIQRSRWDNEFDTSETTPPKYLESFNLRKVRKAASFAWRVVNEDPGGLWVEYGAHAGGKTFVLRYRPMGRGLDIVAARH